MPIHAHPLINGVSFEETADRLKVVIPLPRSWLLFGLFTISLITWVVMLVVVALPSTGGAQPYVVAGAAMAIGMAIAARAEGYFVAATKHLPALRDTPAYLRRLRSNDELSSAGDRR